MSEDAKAEAEVEILDLLLKIEGQLKEAIEKVDLCWSPSGHMAVKLKTSTFF